jgi:hypothetical protein
LDDYTGALPFWEGGVTKMNESEEVKNQRFGDTKSKSMERKME